MLTTASRPQRRRDQNDTIPSYKQVGDHALVCLQHNLTLSWELNAAPTTLHVSTEACLDNLFICFIVNLNRCYSFLNVSQDHV